jgi:hypothetical protein
MKRVLFILFAFAPSILIGQNSKYCISGSLAFGKNNLEQFPVQFGKGNYQFSQKVRTIEIEIGREKVKNYLGALLQLNTSRKGIVNLNNYAFFYGDAFQIKYARILYHENRFNFCPFIKVGFQNNTFIYSNDTNHSNSNISSGSSNEISMLLTNPKGSIGVQFRYKISERSIISVFMEMSSGIISSEIKTYSNNPIGTNTFTPNFFQLGLTYTRCNEVKLVR